MKDVRISDALYARLVAIGAPVDKTMPIDGVISALCGWYEKVMAEIEINPTGDPRRGQAALSMGPGKSFPMGGTGPYGGVGATGQWFAPQPSQPEHEPLAGLAKATLYVSMFSEAWKDYQKERQAEFESGERQVDADTFGDPWVEAQDPAVALAAIVAHYAPKVHGENMKPEETAAMISKFGGQLSHAVVKTVRDAFRQRRPA